LYAYHGVETVKHQRNGCTKTEVTGPSLTWRFRDVDAEIVNDELLLHIPIRPVPAAFFRLLTEMGLRDSQIEEVAVTVNNLTAYNLLMSHKVSGEEERDEDLELELEDA
jgi:hypothetical protein